MQAASTHEELNTVISVSSLSPVQPHLELEQLHVSRRMARLVSEEVAHLLHPCPRTLLIVAFAAFLGP
jgi:hypothetical protein